MRSLLGTGMSFLCLLTLLGCGSRSHDDLLEARLRTQQDQLYRLQAELEQSRSELVVARKQMTLMNTSAISAGGETILPEQADSLSRIAGIQFNRLLTGTLDRDDQPGDDTLHVLITPHDEQESLVKVPGRIRLELLDLTRPTDQRIVQSWDFSIDDCREHWHAGFIGAGYLFKLPWDPARATGSALLHVQYHTPDDRLFDATHQLKTSDRPDGSLPSPLPPPPFALDTPELDAQAHPIRGKESAAEASGPALIRKISSEQPTVDTAARATSDDRRNAAAPFPDPGPVQRPDSPPASAPIGAGGVRGTPFRTSDSFTTDGIPQWR